MRVSREMGNIMPMIEEAKEMNKLPDDVDKTPASVAKYKSGGGLSYKINMN